jgi:hypothetical protein
VEAQLVEKGLPSEPAGQYVLGGKTEQGYW